MSHRRNVIVDETSYRRNDFRRNVMEAPQTNKQHWNIIEYIQLEEPMKNQTRMVGKTVKLKCIVSGYPRPEFTWYKDGKLIEAGVKTIKRGSRFV